MAVNWSLLRPNRVGEVMDAAAERAHRDEERMHTARERGYTDRKRREAEDADKALRSGIHSIYATPQAAPASTSAPQVQPPAAAPASPMPAAPAPALPTGADSAGGDAGQLEQVSAGRAQQPGSREYMQAEASNTPAPPSMPPAPAAPSMPRPAAAAPATTSPLPPSNVQGSQPSGYGTIIKSLANTPGAGAAMLSMYTADQQQQRTAATDARRAANDFEKLAYEHIKAGDWRTAEFISQKHGLAIPPEVFRNRSFMAAWTAGARTADEALGRNASPEHHMAFSQAYANALAQTDDPRQAMTAALNAARAIPRAPAKVSPGHQVADDGRVMVWGDDAQPRALPGFRARQTSRVGTGTSGGGRAAAPTSATERIMQQIMDEAAARGETISPAEAARLARGGNNDTMGKERLAAQQARADRGYRNDPLGTLNRWRAHYGLPGTQSLPREEPAAPAVGGQPAPAAAPAAPAAQPTSVREYVPGQGFVTR